MKCWINKATDTHLEYVTLTAFAAQKSLNERTPVTHYTYMACLIRYSYHFNSPPYSILFYHRRWVTSVSECIIKQTIDTYFSLYLRSLCDELITRTEESYRLWCFVVCDLETSWMRRAKPSGCCRPLKQTNQGDWIDALKNSVYLLNENGFSLDYLCQWTGCLVNISGCWKVSKVCQYFQHHLLKKK
jgi:hypothetical protein